MFNFLKGTFRFEVIHSDNIQTESILTPESLVNYVIGVNNHLIKAEETGWVYGRKNLRRVKKAKSYFMHLKSSCRLYEDNPYFDQLLSTILYKKRNYHLKRLFFQRQPKRLKVRQVHQNCRQNYKHLQSLAQNVWKSKSLNLVKSVK